MFHDGSLNEQREGTGLLVYVVGRLHKALQGLACVCVRVCVCVCVCV